MKFSKKIIVGALACIAAGLVIMVIGLMLGGRSGFYINRSGIHAFGEGERFQKDGGKEPLVLEKTRLEEFDSVDVNIEYADFKLIPSDGYYLEYRLYGRAAQPQYSVKDKKLVFREGDAFSYGNESINFGGFFFWEEDGIAEESFYLNLYVPKEQYFEVFKLYNDSGNVELETLRADKVDLKLDYGDIDLKEFQGKEFNIVSNSGEMNFGIINTEYITAENDYGEILIEDLTASVGDFDLDSGHMKVEKAAVPKIKVNNDYGNVIFRNIVSEQTDIELDSGNLEMNMADLKDLTARNSYGDIDINLRNGFHEYDYDLKTDYGRISVPESGNRGFQGDDEDEEHYKVSNGSAKLIDVDCDSGSITITAGNQ